MCENEHGRGEPSLKSFQRFIDLFGSIKFKLFLFSIVGISAVLLFSLMFSNVKSETYELSAFEISPTTIRSLKTIEDTEKTAQERERAANEVQPSYLFSEEIMKNRQALISSIFDALTEVREKADNDPSFTSTKQLKQVKDRLAELGKEEPDLKLPDELIKELLKKDSQAIESVHQLLLTILGDELSKPIKEADVLSVRYEVERKIRESNQVPRELIEGIIAIGTAAVVPTEVINEELTERHMTEAKNAIEPTRILQGQVIVREGQLIDNEIYRQLKLTGLLTNQSSVKPVIGLVLYVLFVSAITAIHFLKWKRPQAFKKKALLMMYVILFLLVILMKIISHIDREFDLQIAFLFPVALAPMLIRLLTNERTAMLMVILTASTAGIMLQEGIAVIMQMEIALYILFGGVVSLYLLGSRGRRSSILNASLGVALSNLLFVAFYLLMTQSTYNLTEWTFYAVAAVSSGILSGALTIGLLPFFESVFKILSDMRLVELSNPNHPLLKRILVETPGTYHHSIMVANLADAACEAVGANGLLARVGSYYHDIGKTVRPGFFIENQHGGKNLHDDLPPEKSRDIIIAHAEDGAAILEKHNMPSELVDIARQHHGTSLLKFFYVKAKEQNEHVNEDDFRYPGPKPQTKEIAIISIADSVEAAVRSMREPTPQKIEALVESIINTKINDEQFDECDLSMKELKKIKRVICETMNGIFHSRIEYPD